MKVFEAILQDATQVLGQDYFLLPIDGAHPVYRERMYCYELYHQFRVPRPETSDWRLYGEVDKQAHPYFRNGGAPKPDLLVHMPGTRRNYAVIEVKTCRTDINDIRNDLITLSVFVNRFGYYRALFLVYGPDDLLSKVEKAAQIMRQLGPIEVWWHSEHELPAELLAELGH